MSGAPDPAVGDGDGPGQVLDTVAWVLPYKILLGVVAVLALTFFSLPVVLLLGGMLSAGGADGLPLLLVVPAVLWTAVGVLFAACALRAIGLGMVITTEGVQVRSYRRRRWYPWAGIALVRSRQGWRHLGATELELTDGRTVSVWFTSARYALQRGDRRGDSSRHLSAVCRSEDRSMGRCSAERRRPVRPPRKPRSPAALADWSPCPP